MQPGTTLAGRYRLVRSLGEGLSGTTWLAEDREAGDECVVKVFADDADTPGARGSFQEEAERLRDLVHPNLVRLRDIVREEEGPAALVLDRVPGEELASAAAQGGLPRADVLGVLVGCARGLAALHGRGILHRDLQPRNVVVTGESGARDAVLVDLGLAVPRTRRMARELTGTLGFTAPEVILEGSPDERADLYSLGAVLFFVIAGEPPIEATEVLDALARGEDPFVRVERRARDLIPPPFSHLVVRLLSRHPAARFQGAAEVVEEINSRFGVSYALESVETRRPGLAAPPFVGRAAERRSALARVSAALRQGDPAIVVLRGPRGSGRTRFLDELARSAEDLGHPAVRIRATGAVSPPFRPVQGALRAALHRLPEPARRLHEEADRVLAGDGGMPDEARFATAVGLYAGALRAAAEGPVPAILLVDDLDRLDPGTVRVLLRALPGRARGGRGAAALALPAASPTNGGASPLGVLLRRLASDESVLEIPLRPLRRAATDDLFRSLLPLVSMSPGLAERIHDASGGLPMGVVELVRALLDGGHVVYRSGGWTFQRPGARLPITSSAAEAASSRLGRLRDAERRALGLLALAGGTVDAATWRAIEDRTGIGAAGSRSLSSLGFLCRPGEEEAVRLASEVVRESLISSWSRRQEAEHSADLAEILEGAGPGAAPAVVRLRIACGDRAAAVSRGAEALRALRLSHRVDEARSLAGALLEAARAPPGAAGAAPLFEEAAALEYVQRRPVPARTLVVEGLSRAESPAEKRSLLLRLCEIEAFEGRLPEAFLEDLRRLAPDPGEETRGRLALAHAQTRAGRWADAERTLEGILAGGVPEPVLRMRAVNGLAGLRARAGRIDEAERGYREALRLANVIGDATAAATVVSNQSNLAVRRGRYREALRLLEDAASSFGGNLGPAEEVVLLGCRASAIEGLGRWRQVREAASRAIAIAEEEGNPAAAADACARCGVAEARLGNLEAALRSLTRGLRLARGAARPREEREILLSLARIRIERGEEEEASRAMADLDEPAEGTDFPLEALRLLAAAPRLGEGAVLAEVEGLLARPECAAWPEHRTWLRLRQGRALLATARNEEAAAIGAALMAEARRLGAVDDLARALVLDGTARAASDSEAADRRFARALRLSRRLQNVVVRAEVLEACGRYLRTRPVDEARARACLEEASALFGAASLSGRVDAVERVLMSEDEVRPAWRGLRPEKLLWVVERTAEVNAAEDPGQVLEKVLESAVSFTGAERGFLVMARKDGFEVRASRDMTEGEIGSPGKSLSASLVERVLREGKVLTTTDAQRDDRFARFFSVRDLRLRSVLVVPFRRGRRVLGAFYLDNRFLEGVFREEDRRVLELFADQAALAFENASYRAEVRALNEDLRRRMGDQEKQLEGYRATVKSVRRETKYAYDGIIRRGPAMAEVLRLVDQAVDSDVPVLIEGESGTGKEIIARAIHFHGALRQKPFVVVNCAALPETLIESELFGHRRGAFTDARNDRKGQLEAADGGTLFLDEIGELPLPVQPKLLRAIQFGEFVPLGSTGPVRVKVRFVCATNRVLKRMMSAGSFREDLYYRIAVLPIRIPPLRERREDIPGLAESLLRRIVSEIGRGPRRIDRRAVARLMEHTWPGNVREMENVLRRATLAAAGDVLFAEDLLIESLAPSAADPVVARIRESIQGDLAPREEVAIGRLLERGRLSFRGYVSATGVSKATAARDLKRLVAARILVRRGRTSAAFYELAPRWATETT